MPANVSLNINAQSPPNESLSVTEVLSPDSEGERCGCKCSQPLSNHVVCHFEAPDSKTVIHLVNFVCQQGEFCMVSDCSQTNLEVYQFISLKDFLSQERKLTEAESSKRKALCCCSDRICAIFSCFIAISFLSTSIAGYIMTNKNPIDSAVDFVQSYFSSKPE